MNANSTMTDRWMLRRAESLSLPGLKRGASGSWGGLTRDEEGNLYLSDEINHSVISIDREGRLRWQRGGRGSSLEHFRYPKGLALGWVLDEGEPQRCLAVCDSWNNRLQFFDLSGAFIQSWNCAGSLSFAEVSDVRFIPSGERNSGGEGTWLVLDRGNHRLCALTVDGSLLFQIGRTFSPNLESSWSKNALDGLAEGVLSDPAISDFDPLYYPTRILGEGPENLFVHEPFSRRLKWVVHGSLLPVELPSNIGGDWIAAGRDRFLQWDERRGLLHLFAAGGALLASTAIDGHPVCSDLPSTQVWIVSDRELQRWEWVESKEESSGDGEGRRMPLERRGTRSAEGLQSSHIARLVSAASEIDDLANEFLRSSSTGSLSPEILRSTRQRMDPLREELRESSASLSRASHSLFLRLLRQTLREEEDPEVEAERSRWMDLRRPILEAFPNLQRTADALRLAREERSDSGELWRGVLAQMEEDVREAALELHRWVRATAAGADARGSSKEMDRSAAISLPLDFIRPRDRRAVSARSPLREIARLPLAPPDSQSPALPYGLARTSSGGIYVGLFGSNRILKLSESYQVLGPVGGESPEIPGPLGLAVDGRGRMWIVSFHESNLWFYEEEQDALQRFPLNISESGTLRNPVGITPVVGERMMIADTGNHRLVEVEESGAIRVVCDRKGSSLGEICGPIALCPDPASRGTWIVDQRNHRVQFLDSKRRFAASVGALGLTAGKLVLPEYAARFVDGFMVIGQSQVQSALVVFSEQGEERGRILLDYAPGGMLIDRGLLLVTEFDGNHLRVYERNSSTF